MRSGDPVRRQTVHSSMKHTEETPNVEPASVKPTEGTFKKRLLGLATWVLQFPAKIPTPTRWVLLGLVTVAGWVGLGFYLHAMDPKFSVGGVGEDQSDVVTLMGLSGAVGCLQALLFFSRAKQGRRWPARLIMFLVVPVTHILVVICLAHALVHYADDRTSAYFDVYVLGFLGWAVVPLLLMLVLGVLLMVVGLVGEAANRFRQGFKGSDSSGSRRLRAVSAGVCLLGAAGFIVFWVLNFPASPGGFHGVGSAIASSVILFLQALHILRGPAGMYFTVDRVGFLVSVIAMVQAAPFGIAEAVAKKRARAG
jgi:hypothetical protein